MNELANARRRYRKALEEVFSAKVELVAQLQKQYAEVQKAADVDCTAADLEELTELNAEILQLLS